METLRKARILLTLVLSAGSIMSFALDWSGNHLLNPLWHPHARFHGAILPFLFAGSSASTLWLMWRRTTELRAAVLAAAFVSASYWTPFFFVPFLLRGSSYWAGIPGHEPRIDGLVVYPNLVVVGVFLAATLVAFGIAVRAPEQRTTL